MMDATKRARYSIRDIRRRTKVNNASGRNLRVSVVTSGDEFNTQQDPRIAPSNGIFR